MRTKSNADMSSEAVRMICRDTDQRLNGFAGTEIILKIQPSSTGIYSCCPFPGQQAPIPLGRELDAALLWASQVSAQAGLHPELVAFLCNQKVEWSTP